ncbi:bifunctional 4-hydroxy-2-oxoglutarate aldolase/2-dehydro-3-deoxy-phosphogluconate aldolase [Aliivibrio fischeri]|uniref:bifunctional 4-hydroxy-2-oxoglutarate aldolase/2-dehydro-3-deoxy-phosphogluconate aldolase n=1 Tax=Aliivibrio fischeri TaxID=668 RepID=UPI0012D984AE|nr:bifunctional 4-hydroxy-2-oxoglutarate aldolase/2-dehydro-3-deoxy-phosphogluconate aldolase [Aliivibrio fischeri]MUK61797.1 bifunctional 4-hydroxy-2-oxoglutarate aldolase/2-dehydro-3-deoxy-phosphogluconate aldolase [Aliivibrio fischeri]MUK69229.1 bifunctional 4-hydroxy-2-oxoglutarate aldolase/2-dehydro-3-deoxy-phosphogluconate aldolase [Aliivibrio fischeri]MUK71735.1 bifunctional 4-hydroxy-2-oxoglutarate aldolase/2-dehydro-3-deoxy-phosphogluconate aldolase [Aliivibrio fischeri]MUK78260.1 bifu
MQTIEQQLKEIKVVPVIAIEDKNNAVPLAKVLIDNGLPCAEVTFRTEAAAESIRLMREAYPSLLIGAGTVLTTHQVDEAINAGADFIVSPGLNPITVTYCLEKNIPIIPGVNNPSLVEQAMSLGLKTVKFFPAEPSGGLPMLKALSAVYPVEFMPTGGISPSNVSEYLALTSVIACGGTWMVPNSMINDGDWEGLAKLVKDINH